MDLRDDLQHHPGAGRRYSIKELIDIGRQGRASIEVRKFSSNALQSGLLTLRNVSPEFVLAPLNGVSGNRVRGYTDVSNSSVEENLVFPGTGGIHPVRQPQNAPVSSLAQKDAGFARFLKQHSSPTHQRVTAGGRIVPMVRPQPPPLFSLSTVNQAQYGAEVGKDLFNPSRILQDDIYKLETISEHKTPYLDRGNGNVRLESFRNNETRGEQRTKPTKTYSAENLDGNMEPAAEPQKPSMVQSIPSSYQLTPIPNLWVPYPPATPAYMPALLQNHDIVQPLATSQPPSSLILQQAALMHHTVDQNPRNTTKCDIHGDGLLPTKDQNQSDQRSFANQEQSNARMGASMNRTVYPGLPYYATPSPMHYTQPTLPFGNPGYQQWSWPMSTAPYLPGLFPAPHYSNADTMGTATMSNVNPDLNSRNTQNLSQKQAENPDRDPYEAAVDWFKMNTRHLSELDQFMAVHGNKLSRTVHDEKVRERMSIVVKRSDAYRLMKSLEQQRQTQADQQVASKPASKPASSSARLTIKTPATQNSARKTLNVEAAPWTPQNPNCTRSGRSGNRSLLDINTDAPKHNTPNEEGYDQDSIHIQTSEDADQHSMAPSSSHSRQLLPHIQLTVPCKIDQVSQAGRGLSGSPCQVHRAGFYGSLKSVDDKHQIIASSCNHDDQEVHDDNNNNQELVLASSSAEPVSSEREAEANYETLLDALRLPKGCVTKVNIIGGAETMVHGQGLKQPPWEELTEFEREYWIRKPDNVFFPHNSSIESILADASGPSVGGFSGSTGVEARNQRHSPSQLNWMVSTNDECRKDTTTTPFGQPASRSQAALHLEAPSTNNSIYSGTYVPKADVAPTMTSKASVMTSAIDAEAKLPPNEGGRALLQRNSTISQSVNRGSMENKPPASPRGPRGFNDVHQLPFFRGFWSYEDEINNKPRGFASPF